MGPNVKFVSAITDAFSNKKMGVNFFPEKRPNPGGFRGRFGKRPYFSRIFFEPFPYRGGGGIAYSRKWMSSNI